MATLSEAKFFGSLYLLQDYWQCPLAPKAQDIFTIATPGGLYTPTGVPQGILNATSYFQATLTRVLEGLNCMFWVDDVIYWGLDETDLFNTLELILERLWKRSDCMLRLTSAPFSRRASLGAGRCTRRGKSSTILSG